MDCQLKIIDQEFKVEIYRELFINKRKTTKVLKVNQVKLQNQAKKYIHMIQKISSFK